MTLTENNHLVTNALAESSALEEMVPVTIINEYPRTKTDEDTVLDAIGHYDNAEFTVARCNNDTWDVTGVVGCWPCHIRVTVA
jgi:hypothetical protein